MDISTLHISPQMLSIISSIDEFKGTWKVLGTLAPDKLVQLQKVATIESIGSSTRIEGSKLSNREVESLLANLTIKKFETRDEQEVGGYAQVMNLIFENFESVPLSENYIKQLHSLLLQYSDKDQWHKGNYKTSPNHVVAFDADGKEMGIVFETASVFDTPFQMQHLVQWANEQFETKELHPLLIIGVFNVSFLAIHPFQDGNGRLSRILTTLLLLKYGYVYVPYSSLEAVIEKNKQGYYLSLRQTQTTIGTDKPDWQPWLIYFLKALQQQKEKLEQKIGYETALLTQLPELSKKIIELISLRGRITTGELHNITGMNRNTIKKHLENLVKSNRIQLNGTGKGSWYSLKISG
ncbi:MAG: Fic family protein [Chitinophagaceae bacterium]|nr:Fic family protein [Chitinophagaceae bacterium]